MLPVYQYLRLGFFTYHVLTDPYEIKKHLMKWIMQEWEMDHLEAPHEHWTVAWMEALPRMEFGLKIVQLTEIRLHPDLMKVKEFQVSLRERADEREDAILRGVSIEPLVIDQNDFVLMDGYTRYTVLKRYNQKEIYAYVGCLSDGEGP